MSETQFEKNYLDDKVKGTRYEPLFNAIPGLSTALRNYDVGVGRNIFTPSTWVNTAWQLVAHFTIKECRANEEHWRICLPFDELYSGKYPVDLQLDNKFKVPVKMFLYGTANNIKTNIPTNVYNIYADCVFGTVNMQGEYVGSGNVIDTLIFASYKESPLIIPGCKIKNILGNPINYPGADNHWDSTAQRLWDSRTRNFKNERNLSELIAYQKRLMQKKTSNVH